MIVATVAAAASTIRKKKKPSSSSSSPSRDIKKGKTGEKDGGLRVMTSGSKTRTSRAFGRGKGCLCGGGAGCGGCGGCGG
ncbi:hypothetical protein ISN44_As06g045880 [Arabidopsis suecica]|uniref:Uncharacterized protein n=1 Tax=Arabidopsis suecica TaxID=45249 RepID=A0A8T2CLS8_ARASU|nr:hypothetical protein ISN44_As06g045880 [Arabidopsis suecica]